MRLIVLCLGILLVVSCKSDLKDETERPVEKEQEFKKSEKNISERFLRIQGDVDTLRHAALGKDLFGRFFKHRLEFYIIDNPNKTIYNKPVKAITLYFVDGILARTKYQLDEDVSDDLIQSYGAFSIQAYDSLTRRLSKSKKILYVVDQRKTIDKKLTNYRLKWTLDSKVIYTRVDKTAPKKRFEYVESLKDYEARYTAAELDM
jgi:hypothetical protein